MIFVELGHVLWESDPQHRHDDGEVTRTATVLGSGPARSKRGVRPLEKNPAGMSLRLSPRGRKR